MSYLQSISKIVYVDMVADLLHYGHMNFLEQIYNKFIKNTSNKLYIGIHNDETVKSYKRLPILNMDERIKVISFCKYIDKIIPNAPLKIEKNYIDLHNIDIICIPDNRTQKETELMCSVPLKLGMIRKLKYTNTISTSEIIKRIKNRNDI